MNLPFAFLIFKGAPIINLSTINSNSDVEFQEALSPKTRQIVPEVSGFRFKTDQHAISKNSCNVHQKLELREGQALQSNSPPSLCNSMPRLYLMSYLHMCKYGMIQ